MRAGDSGGQGTTAHPFDVGAAGAPYSREYIEAQRPATLHLYTHTKPESVGQAGRWQSNYHDTMIDHDKNVGTVLKALDDLGIANDTVFF